MHKKSSMRSVHVKLPLHGLEPQLSISEAKKKLLSLNPKLFIIIIISDLIISRKDCVLFLAWSSSLETLQTF